MPESNPGAGDETLRATTTRCLTRIGRGDAAGASELLPLVYAELRALAAAQLRRERPDHTLQPTALVHEVFLKLVDQTHAGLKDRSHFFAVAAEAIRRVLVDHARGRNAAKRRLPGERVAVRDDLDAIAESEVDVLELDEALGELARLSPRQARVVELRFFAGLGVEETAAAIGVSEGTVKGEWRVARAWLQRRLSLGGAGT